MALIGNLYIDATDPGAVGAGYWWYDPTTGEAYSRNTTNDAWVAQGNWDYSHSGNLPLTGGAMTGPIMTTGVSSWAPIASPNFSGTPQKSGIALATTQDLATEIAALKANINSLIAQAVASTSAAITIGNNLAIGYGSVNDAGTIPLPQYSNGDDATIGEIIGVMVSVKDLNVVTYSGLSYEWKIICNVNSSLYVRCYGYKADSPTDVRAGTANYIIICSR